MFVLQHFTWLTGGEVPMSTSNFISKEWSNLFFQDGDMFFLQEKAKKQTNSILFITCNCYTSTRCYGRRIISKAISANLKLFSSLLCVYLSTIFYFVFQRPRIFLAFDIFLFGMISRFPSVKTQTVRYWYIRPNSKFFRKCRAYTILFPRSLKGKGKIFRVQTNSWQLPKNLIAGEP